MGISSLFGINSASQVRALDDYPRLNVNSGSNFVKNTFNFEKANPNRPESRVAANALGDPTKGCNLYCLG